MFKLFDFPKTLLKCDCISCDLNWCGWKHNCGVWKDLVSFTSNCALRSEVESNLDSNQPHHFKLFHDDYNCTPIEQGWTNSGSPGV